MTQKEAEQISALAERVAVLETKINELNKSVDKILDAVSGKNGINGRMAALETTVESIEHGDHGPRKPCREQFAELKRRTANHGVNIIKAWGPVLASMIAAAGAVYAASQK